MPIKILPPNKGALGHMLDMRKSMKDIEIVCHKWCAAFDAGDMDSLAALSDLMAESIEDARIAADGVVIASGADL